MIGHKVGFFFFSSLYLFTYIFSMLSPGLGTAVFTATGEGYTEDHAVNPFRPRYPPGEAAFDRLFTHNTCSATSCAQ